ncbi:hypothetical protein ACV07N_10760 [Roseivirga echinicomitans]
MKKFILLLLVIPFFANAQIVSKGILDFSDSGTKKLRDIPKKIYIKEFNVGYQYFEDGSAKSENYDKSTESITIAAILNAGLTTDDVQNITDEAYRKFSNQLKDAGFELVGEEEASEIPFFQSGQVTRNVGGVPIDANGYIYTLPVGTTRIDKVTNVSAGISKAQNTISSLSKGLGSLAKIADIGKKDTYQDPKIKISEELGVPVVEFGMNFSFIQFKNALGGSVLKGTSGLNAAIYKGTLINKGDGKMGNAESVVQVVPKKGRPIEIEGVIEKNKISKMADADNAKTYRFGTEYRQDVTIKQTKLVDADKATYVAKVSQALDEYLNILATTIIESFN